MTRKIPPIIWTFWHSDEAPPLVRLCQRRWAHFNPDYQIRVLTFSNVETFVPKVLLSQECFQDSLTRVSDLVRLWVLSVYGGVWLDASILLGEPLASPGFLGASMATESTTFIGFYIQSMMSKERDWSCPVVENWCFACVPRCPFVTRWREEFCLMPRYGSAEAYVQALQTWVDIQAINNPVYLACHVAAQAVLQREPDLLANMVLLSAEAGPFRYLAESRWRSLSGLVRLCSNPEAYLRPMAKLRSCEREALGSFTDEESGDLTALCCCAQRRLFLLALLFWVGGLALVGLVVLLLRRRT